MVKILKLEHYQNCFEISKLKNRIGGFEPLSEPKFQEIYYKYFLEFDNFLSLGYFEKNTLVSWVALSFYQNKSRGRFWVIPCFYTSKFRNVFTYNVPEIGLLFKEAFELAESRNYFEYYYAITKRIQNVYNRQWKKNKYMITGRYDYIDLDCIPPNTHPEKELYWKLMGEKLSSETVLIKKRTLKEEYMPKLPLNNTN